MPAKTLMVQGTMSSAGKSLLVCGLCRLFSRRGLRVVPYKSQNMSNNAGVCADGSEIGRAQYTQALACGLKPAAEMNPILLKPEADSRSQVVLMGKPYASLPAREYYRIKNQLWLTATQALDSLREKYDLVLIEGAGSPVEMNLKSGDIVNMAVARYAKAPVLLAGDIDRGGIFAQLLGTLWLLEEDERQLVKGLIVNKFRGDLSLFEDGKKILESKGGVPVIGVVPYTHHQIPEEDAVAIEAQNWQGEGNSQIRIVIPRFPRIANFDDFDPLQQEPGVSISYIDSPSEFGNPDAVILPGTKSTLADLAWLRSQGLEENIRDFAKNGGAVVGICGGYQMLGKRIEDKENIESFSGEMAGIGLLDMLTEFHEEKVTHQIQALVSGGQDWLTGLQEIKISGYEIHMGKSHVKKQDSFLRITRRSEQIVSETEGYALANGRIWGCYIHGLFENTVFRRAWLASLGWQAADTQKIMGIQQSFDLMADVLEESLDMNYLEKILQI